VIYLEDDDVAAIQKGCLSIHRIKRTMDESTIREVITLKMELQEIMKGKAHVVISNGLIFYISCRNI
jgi:glucosamine--fructose-6-phosphate aminotransferase (isomerizing)